MLRHSVFVVGIASAMLSTASLAQDDPVLLDLYGRGVHAYFAGDTSGTLENFNAAIGGGSRDPRVYYFRGLANERFGRTEASQADFRQGAALETADSDRYFDVSRALERIQGNRRVALIALSHCRSGNRPAKYTAVAPAALRRDA